MNAPETAKEFAHVHLPSGSGVPADETGYARYYREKVMEGIKSAEEKPLIPHERVMARAWAIVGKDTSSCHIGVVD